MDREETIRILNANLGGWQVESANKVIIEYLLENNIELDKAGFFIKTLMENPMIQLCGAFDKCLTHSLEYFITKYSINSILKNNITFIYY